MGLAHRTAGAFNLKMLAPRFLDRFEIEYSGKDIDDLVDMRNRIVHYADEG
jgi:hypothetical protein